MLKQIHDAYHLDNWLYHIDVKVRRPSEPLTGGENLARQFQAARRLANDQKFEEAKTGIGNIKRVAYDEWGTECNERNTFY